MEVTPIAYLRGDLPEKFGLPRQSGLAEGVESRIVFTPPWRDGNALRGIEGFSHLWLIWGFSLNPPGAAAPTVRPPRLGGNRRLGVFATRSPFRPNALGLSCVRLLGVESVPGEGCQLRVAGADLADGTPIYDIKPYVPLTDCRPGARGGFTESAAWQPLTVRLPDQAPALLPPDKLAALTQVLAQDPRPAYQRGEEGRTYAMTFAGLRVRFCVTGETLTVLAMEKL